MLTEMPWGKLEPCVAAPAFCALVFLLSSARDCGQRSCEARSWRRGSTNPIAFVVDPVDPSTFYVVEQRGTIRIVRNNSVLPAMFLDIRSAISSGGERGLLGLAFPPDAVDSRRFFVNFTNPDGHTVVARYTRDAHGRGRSRIRVST